MGGSNDGFQWESRITVHGHGVQSGHKISALHMRNTYIQAHAIRYSRQPESTAFFINCASVFVTDCDSDECQGTCLTKSKGVVLAAKSWIE